ncbi:MAG: hypothetical protein ACRCRW_07870, partial [Aeromonadaceae bacterium]
QGKPVFTRFPVGLSIPCLLFRQLSSQPQTKQTMVYVLSSSDHPGATIQAGLVLFSPEHHLDLLVGEFRELLGQFTHWQPVVKV